MHNLFWLFNDTSILNVQSKTVIWTVLGNICSSNKYNQSVHINKNCMYIVINIYIYICMFYVIMY